MKYRLSFVSGEWVVAQPVSGDLKLAKARKDNCFEMIILHGQHFTMNNEHKAWVDLTHVVYITEVN